MHWKPRPRKKFKLFISKIPVFHRHITEVAVIKRAEELAKSESREQVVEKDVVCAFFY